MVEEAQIMVLEERMVQAVEEEAVVDQMVMELLVVVGV